MNTGLDVERCVTVAAYSAFVLLRKYLAKNPSSTPDDAVSVIRATDSDDAGLDYVGGQEIHLRLNDSLDLGPATNHIRTVIGELIRVSRPWWLSLIPYGREKVKSALTRDQVQCLREAGLFDTFPKPEAVAWWDEMAGLARSEADKDRMLQARSAERLSLEYERHRLKELGIELEPVWVSLEDNTLGYDIRSYHRETSGVVSRLIEVKSTMGDSIFVTRNEWANAVGARHRYFFHVWFMPDQRFVEYPSSAVQPNIPVDRGAGRWQEVRVTVERS